jgi:hypothetical protein
MLAHGVFSSLVGASVGGAGASMESNAGLAAECVSCCNARERA